MKRKLSGVITGISLLFLLPMHVTAFGEINPVEWELRGIGDSLRKIDSGLRDLKSLEQERNSRLIEIKNKEVWNRTYGTPTSRPSLDLDPDKCPLHSRPLSEQEAYGSELLAQIDEMQRFQKALQFPTQSAKLGLSSDLVSEIQRMTYTERSFFRSAVYSKLQELYAVQYERTEQANVLCRCDVGWIGSGGQCVSEQKKQSAKRVQPATSSRARMRACKRDQDGICQCPAGYKPSSKTSFVAADGKVYTYSGRQVCAK